MAQRGRQTKHDTNRSEEVASMSMTIRGKTDFSDIQKRFPEYANSVFHLANDEGSNIDEMMDNGWTPVTIEGYRKKSWRKVAKNEDGTHDHTVTKQVGQGGESANTTAVLMHKPRADYMRREYAHYSKLTRDSEALLKTGKRAHEPDAETAEDLDTYAPELSNGKTGMDIKQEDTLYKD